MAEQSAGRDQAEIVEVARAILDGSMGIIEGARRLNDLRAAMGIYHLDEDFVRVVAIDSETDQLPIGEVRKLWDDEALVQKDREVKEAERMYRAGVLEDCRKLIARFGGPSNRPLKPRNGERANGESGSMGRAARG